jgi:hypothetical protein
MGGRNTGKWNRKYAQTINNSKRRGETWVIYDIYQLHICYIRVLWCTNTMYWHQFAHHFEFASIVTVTPIKPKFQGSRSFVHCITVSTHILVQFNRMCPCLCIGSKSGCELAPKITSLHTRGNEPLEECTLAHCCSFIMIVHIYYTVNIYKILWFIKW